MQLHHAILIATLLTPALSAQTQPRLDRQRQPEQRLTLPPAGELPDRFSVIVSHHEQPHTLHLWRHSIRATGFRVRVADARGALIETPTPPVTTYRGHLDRPGGAPVAASLGDRGLHAAVLPADGKSWFVEPASAERGTHVAYDAADNSLPPGWCGGGVATPMPAPAPGRGGGPTAAAFKIAEIAFDADYEYFKILGSVDATVRNIEAAMAAVNLIYERDVQIGHRITQIIVRTAEPDPYDQADPGPLLRQFRDHWVANQGAVRRDVAHLMTGRDMTGNVIGIAYVSVVCNTSWHYGVSQWRSNLSNRITVLGHELGHNWSAPHCLDPSCVLMCGGCHQFGPLTAAKIIAYRDSRTCLDALAPPKLTAVTPSSIGNGHTGGVELAGSDLDYVTAVEFGGKRLTSFSRDSATRLRFSPPLPVDFAKYPIKAHNAVGVSTPVDLTVTGEHPSVLGVPPHAIRRFPFAIAIHTDARWQALVLVSSEKLPSIVPGIVRLGIGNAFASLVPVATLAADQRGRATLATILPVTIAAGDYHWQAVTFDPAKLQAPLEVSNVATGRIY